MTWTPCVAVLVIALLVSGCFFPRKTNVWAHRGAYVVDAAVILTSLYAAGLVYNCFDGCYCDKDFCDNNNPTAELLVAAVGGLGALVNAFVIPNDDAGPAASPRAQWP